MHAPWRLLLLVAAAGAASDADQLDPLAMHQMLQDMRVQMSELQRAHEETREHMSKRMSNLEADNKRLRAARAFNVAPSRAEKWAVETTGAGRQLSQSQNVSQSCCRWTNARTCETADVTYACTQLHEYMERKTTTHVFEDVSSCPGSDPSALFQAQTAEVAMSSGGSEVARVPTPLRVTHASDCTGATMRVQLNTTVGGNLEVEGSLTVRGNLVVDGALTVNGASIGAPSSPSWVDVSISSLAGVTGDAAYMINDGMVYWKGTLTRSTYGWNTHENVLPSIPWEAAPSGGEHRAVVAVTSSSSNGPTTWIGVTFSANTGTAYIWSATDSVTYAQGNGAGTKYGMVLFLHGISYPAA